MFIMFIFKLTCKIAEIQCYWDNPFSWMYPVHSRFVLYSGRCECKKCITAWLLTVSFFFHKIKTQPDGTRISFLSFTLAFHFVPFNKCLISIKISQSNFVEIKHSSFLKAQKIHKIYNWSSQSQLTITLMIGFFIRKSMILFCVIL